MTQNILLAINNKGAEIAFAKKLKEKSEDYTVSGCVVHQKSITDFIKDSPVDILVYREGLPGNENDFKFIANLKKTNPTLRIIFMADERKPGDKNLADLVAFNVFDIITGNTINLDDIIDMTIHPKTWADASIYLPGAMVQTGVFNKNELKDIDQNAIVKKENKPENNTKIEVIENPDENQKGLPPPPPQEKKHLSLKDRIFKKKNHIQDDEQNENNEQKEQEEQQQKEQEQKEQEEEKKEIKKETEKQEKKLKKEEEKKEKQEKQMEIKEENKQKKEHFSLLRPKKTNDDQEENKETEETSFIRSKKYSEMQKQIDTLKKENEKKKKEALKLSENKKKIEEANEKLKKEKEAMEKELYNLDKNRNKNSRQKIVLFYGAVPGTGTSVSALNTAAYLALKNYKVVLIEFNDVIPTLSSYLAVEEFNNGLERAFNATESKSYTGIDDCILTKEKILDMHTEIMDRQKKLPDNLAYMFFSNQYIRSKEFIRNDSDRLKDIMMFLLYKKDYDYVILDLYSFSDTHMLETISMFSSINVFVLTQDITTITNSLRVFSGLKNSGLKFEYWDDKDDDNYKNIILINKYNKDCKVNYPVIKDWLKSEKMICVPENSTDVLNGIFYALPSIMISKNKEFISSYKTLIEKIENNS